MVLILFAKIANRVLFFSSLLIIHNIDFAQNLVINEIMSSNTDSYKDEFGSYPDWIEIYNNSSQTINLSSFALSDNLNNISKWNFPDIDLESDENILVAASGRDIRNTTSSWETIINQGDIWKYFLGKQEPPEKWRDINFSDLNWKSGFSGIGYGDGDDRTEIENVSALYLRKTFSIEDITKVTQVMFNIDFDDAYVAYLNGIEISRKNIGLPYELVPFDRFSDIYSEARLYQNQELDAVFVDDAQSILMNGDNILAIQVHNSDLTSSDLTAIPFLTLGFNYSSTEINVADEIISQLPTLHTNFKISNGQESVYLSNIEGTIIDTIGVVFIPNNLSYGRYPDGNGSLHYFDQPTPGESNLEQGYIDKVDDPLLNLDGGFYNNPVTIQLLNESMDKKTYYTLDGSEPNTNSSEFLNYLNINSTSVVKIKSYVQNQLPSSTNSHTFFINEEKYLPTISLSTDPKNLWDYNTGIYVIGPNAESTFPFFGANFWQDWEKPAHFELFQDGSSRALTHDVIIKIFGGWSRGQSQKSISVFPQKDFEYDFFSDLDIDKFSSIVLRNSGNDWNFTMLRDGLVSRIANQLNIDNLAYEPAELYLNGEYWGIHNIREKLNLSYIGNHFNIDKDKINLLELKGNVIDGSSEEYFQLIEYLNSNSLIDQEKYNYVKSQIDIDNFIDYQLLQIFIANVDWPGNNLKFWKKQGTLGKWRWILFDTDFGLGWMYGEDYTHNTLHFALEVNGPEWPNPPWSTLILRKLIENSEFKQKFINRYSDLVNTSLSYLSIHENLTEASEKIKLAIPRHSQKWNQFSFDEWLKNIEVIERFAVLRSLYLNSYFEEEFNLGNPSEIEFTVFPSSSGKIKINSVITHKSPWIGKYFKDHQIKLTAVPNPGYTFIGWSGGSNDTSDSLEIIVEDWSTIQANFEKDNSHPQIVINEINYNSSSVYDTEDWVEIYNKLDNVIDLSNWKLKDGIDTNIYIIPPSTYLRADDYLVICRDTLDFKSVQGNTVNIIGNFNFGLNNSGDLIRLYNKFDILIDSVRYDNNFPWPIEADGGGSTLELTNPANDNSVYYNWSASLSLGSPGDTNAKLVLDVNNPNEKSLNNFNISQNYPNPFNPSTVINFSIPRKSNVSLKIYDVLGNEVAELVNAVKSEGEHSVLFDGINLPSGVYFYRITTESSNIVKKMILIK